MVFKKVCVRCGYDGHQSSVHCHHIDRNWQNNNPTNLIYLCANCHFSLHHDAWKLDEIGIIAPNESKKVTGRGKRGVRTYYSEWQETLKELNDLKELSAKKDLYRELHLTPIMKRYHQKLQEWTTIYNMSCDFLDIIHDEHERAIYNSEEFKLISEYYISPCITDERLLISLGELIIRRFKEI